MSNAPTLRPYQENAAAAVLSARQRGVNRALYVLPTGTGKTVTAGTIIDRIRQKDNRPAIVLAHREELLDQASETFARMMPGVNIEMEKGGKEASRFADIIVASLPTIARQGSTRLGWLADTGPSVIWYDEAHHAAADGAGRALARFGCFSGKTFLVGCTATPHRLDNKPLEGSNGEATFQENVFTYSLLDAIRDRWLCDLRGFVVRTGTDLSGVATRGGDFAEGELAKRVNSESRNKLAVKHWKELASDRQTIAFCASVDHAEDAAKEWTDAGYRAEMIHGGMSRDDRRAVLDRFRAGITQVLTNCQIATEGFDHPPTACIVMLRPTKSWSLYAQMAGRGTRLHPGKADCIILDLADNCDELSLMSAPRLVDLPAGTDLEGASLFSSREELDMLGPKAAHLPQKPGKWKDMVSVAKEVPLFIIPSTPPEVAAVGAMRWLRLPKGLYVSCGDGREGWLHEDTLGHFHMALREPTTDANGRKSTVETFRRKAGEDLEGAVRYTERYLRTVWPSAGAVATRTARWGGDAPSEKQIALIQKLMRGKKAAGFDITKVVTKGDASALISSLMAEKGAAV